MIVVTTPTGRIGRQLVDRLLDQDAEVRVIVRDAAQLDAQVRSRVEVVEGSHADAAALDRALPAADAVFWLVPPNPDAPSAAEHYLAFARAGSAAIRRHGVGHVVAVTSAGHDWKRPAGLLSAAFAMDVEMRASGAAYRAVSLPFYMENLLGQADAIARTGTLSLSCAADRPLAMIATRDIAGQSAGLLTDLSWTGQADVPVFSPDRLTPAEMVRVIGEELGRTVAYRRVALEDFAAMLRTRGASEQAVRDTVEMFASQDEGIYDADWAHATLAPTDFRTWCREVLAPAVEQVAPQPV